MCHTRMAHTRQTRSGCARTNSKIMCMARARTHNVTLLFRLVGFSLVCAWYMRAEIWNMRAWGHMSTLRRRPHQKPIQTYRTLPNRSALTAAYSAIMSYYMTIEMKKKSNFETSQVTKKNHINMRRAPWAKTNCQDFRLKFAGARAHTLRSRVSRCCTTQLHFGRKLWWYSRVLFLRRSARNPAHAIPRRTATTTEHAHQVWQETQVTNAYIRCVTCDAEVVYRICRFFAPSIPIRGRSVCSIVRQTWFRLRQALHIHICYRRTNSLCRCNVRTRNCVRHASTVYTRARFNYVRGPSSVRPKFVRTLLRRWESTRGRLSGHASWHNKISLEYIGIYVVENARVSDRIRVSNWIFLLV